jgi:tetratricopeptide (TPR) repeat protein
VTAYHFAAALVWHFGAVTVDRKEYENDRFDDLAVNTDSLLVRRQIKSSKDLGRCFELRDLTTKRRDLEIDSLIQCYKNAGSRAANEYRLCATWKAPTDTEAQTLLEPVAATPTFHGYPTKLYRLRADLIWPTGGAPTWQRLRQADGLTRQYFLDFTARFVIELECPPASTDLTVPDALELLLLNLLTDQIGIGRYPNHTRNPVDVATQLVQLAARARAENRTLHPSEIENAIQLQKDFGRVAQQFPLDKAIEVERPLLQQNLLGLVDSRRVILTGTPGSGKSWALTELAENLKRAGCLVSRHYCYLEPGDPQVQRRITTDVLFANLIYELIHDLPALRKFHQPVYSAGPRELEDLLRKGVEAGLITKAALIVDGVDHVSRVFFESKNLAVEDVDIVEELASLRLPDEVSLFVGSQPGPHLDPLWEGAVPVSMPDWNRAEVAALAVNLGVPSALRNARFDTSVDDYLEQLHERSEGNPLYATFLCRQTLASIAEGRAFDPVESLREAPLIEGQISRYYDYLFSSLEKGSTSGVVAELLGVIDFGLTEQEIQEIYPQFAHRIPAALSFLAPITTRISAQSGVRIYHESFRRFVTNRLRGQGGSVADVITPVIYWLTGRGFYRDAKAYRFLIPSLRRAGRNREALELVGAQFVSSSVKAGHSRRAIEENLKLATYIAADELDWAALARCAELHRSCITCFQEKLLDIESFGRTYAAIFGAAALNERLLFDGQPTFPAHEGLLFCALCDDAGEVPPWAQYLDLNSGGNKKPNDQRGGSASDTDWETFAVAEVYGALRVDGVESVFRRVVNYLERLPSPPVKYLRLILERMVQFGGTEILFRLLDEAKMSEHAASLVLIELAKALVAEGETDAAKEAATKAVRLNDSVELAAEGLMLGADRDEVAKRLPDLSKLDIAVGADRYISQDNQLKLWVEGVRIAANVNPQALESELKRIGREGWYRAWLRFAVVLSQAEAQARVDTGDAEAQIRTAFSDLASDPRPFVGKPRACDLYYIHALVHETISRALHLLYSTEAWEETLKNLAEISRGTTTYLQRSPGGPLQPEHLIELLIPFARNSLLNDLIMKAIKHQLELTGEGSELYETHAIQELLLARVLAEAGQSQDAQSLWHSATVHLCAYGYRKDTTIYELIESAPALASVDRERTRAALATVQPLVNAVVQHTDGKETKHAPVYWIEALSEVDPVGGAAVLARSLVQHGGTVDWRHEDSFNEVCSAVCDSGDPLLLTFLEATLPFAGGAGKTRKRLKTVERLVEKEPHAGEHMLRMLAAQVQGDPESFDPTAYAELERFAHAHGFDLAPGNRDVGLEAEKEKDSYGTQIDPLDAFRDNPVFPGKASPLEIMAIIRSVRGLFRRNAESYDRISNAFGYRLIELIDRGAEEDAIRLLRCFARESYFEIGATPLADLATGLERHGHQRAASVAFALAYARSRGGYGWEALGDTEHLPWMSQALRLSEKEGASTLANEVAHLLNNQHYIMGVTRHLIEVCSNQISDPNVAFNTWYAAFEVISHRLPDNENDISTFVTYVPELVMGWSLDEALVSLLLARVSHPELKRKITALSGVAAVVSSIPSTVINPLRQFLSVDTPISSALIVLHALVEAEQAPYPVTAAVRDEVTGLYRSDLFGLRALAQTLLERAGFNPEDIARPNRQLPATPTLPEWEEERILSIDDGGRVTDIAQIWPEFPSLVARRYDHLWKASKTRKELSRYRYKAAKSSVHDLPPTELLFWEEELFEAAFHEVLDGIDYYLLESDELSPSLISDIGARVLPRVHTHVSNWHSRSPRPPLPTPSAQRAGVEPVSPVEGSDEYAGWYRCGYFERELLISEDSRKSFTGTLMVMAGIQFPQEPGVVDQSKITLANGDADAWWRHYGERVTSLTEFVGCVVGLDYLVDWLGKRPMLSLQPNLVENLKLQAPTSWQSRLALTDSSGQNAIVFRSWSARPVGNSIDEESPRLEGADLLMRPDVFEQMLRIGLHPPLMVKLVHRNDEP